MELTDKPKKPKVKGKHRAKSILLLSIVTISLFSFVPTAFISASFAQVTVFAVNNEIWINATGISPSSETGQNFIELKLVVSQQLDTKGEVRITANEGDRAFTPLARDDFLLFKDLRRSYTNDPNDIINLAPNCERYFGFHYNNNSLNLSSIPNSYFEALLPAVPFGASVQETYLVFNSPASYAEDYCLQNGYTYLNVINASYEKIVNYQALNTYRSRLLQTAMYTLEDTSLSESSIQASGEVHSESFTLAAIGICLAVAALIWGISYLIDVLTPDPPAPPAPPAPLDPPPANEIENMTKIAIETFGRSAEAALAAFLNGTISLEAYLAIINALDNAIFGGLNSSIISLEGLWRDYYNVSESMYDTYSGMYDNYLEAFSATWTDWFLPILIMIIVIIILVIVYKVVSRKQEAPVFLNYR